MCQLVVNCGWYTKGVFDHLYYMDTSKNRHYSRNDGSEYFTISQKSDILLSKRPINKT